MNNEMKLRNNFIYNNKNKTCKINLTKEMSDFHIENHRILLK